MSNRQAIEACFTEQRKKREAALVKLQVALSAKQRMKHPSPFALLFLVLALFIVGTALALPEFEQMARPSMDLPELFDAPTTVLVVVTAIGNVATPELAFDLPTVTTAPDLRHVCTGVPGGHLHVRLTPGQGSEVRGYLIDGETVRAATEAHRRGQ